MTRKRILILGPVSIGELTIESKLAVKRLGLVLDWKMIFFEQIRYGLMAFTKRYIVCALLRRRAWWVAFAYRTLLEPTAIVIVGVIPVTLLGKERKAINSQQAKVHKAIYSARALT